jgi:hypothetical protein
LIKLDTKNETSEGEDALTPEGIKNPHSLFAIDEWGFANTPLRIATLYVGFARVGHYSSDFANNDTIAIVR